jgi:hypothetical protein
MFRRFRGPADEYIWEKEQERRKRYKARPWELQSKEPRRNPFVTFLFGCLGILIVLLLFNLF